MQRNGTIEMIAVSRDYQSTEMKWSIAGGHIKLATETVEILLEPATARRLAFWILKNVADK